MSHTGKMYTIGAVFLRIVIVKIGIQSRLFIAFLGSIALAVAAMALLVNWSFQRGLEDYLHQQETSSFAMVLDTLALSYSEFGGWDFLRNNRFAWHMIMDEVIGRSNATTSLPGSEQRPPPLSLRRPPRTVFDLRQRLRLFDAGGKFVIGHEQAGLVKIRSPVIWEGKTVGHLELIRKEIINDELALGFQISQRRTYLLISILTLMLAMLTSMVLARRLLQPVRSIAQGANKLAAGDYQMRISIERDDELGRLAEDFNHMAGALARNEQLRRQWIADISHELRTPIAILRSEIEALIDGIRQTSPQRLHNLHDEVLNLGKLVDDLYELALSDQGSLDYRREPLDLSDLVDQVVEGFRPRFDKRELDLVNHLSAPMPFNGDKRRLQQLFTNLLENSLRYTDPGGGLMIDQQSRSNTYLIRLMDTKPGVPDDALPRLFERLYRVDRSRSRALGGAGLGLAICRNIVEAHAGKIELDHAETGGLGVNIHLPVN